MSADNVFPVFADFFDGRSALPRRAELKIDGDVLVIAAPEAPVVQWPLGDLREIPDQADSRIVAVTSVSHPLARLYVSGVAGESLRARAPNVRRKPPVRGLGRIAGWSAAAIASVAAIIFVLVPLMADQLAEYLPPDGEKALGDATFEQIRNALSNDDFAGIALCETPDGRAALDRMTERLTSGLELPYPLTVSVLDHEMLNAFALPGGHVVFFRGLIDAAEDPDEVAAVMAHEIGHVVARDPTRIALRSAGSIGVLGLLLGDFAGGAVVLFMAEWIIQADYTKEAEAAADAFAHDLMIEAGLPTAALARFFERLRAEYGDAEGIVEHFLTHPQLGDRIAAAEVAGEGQDGTTPSLSGEEWRALQGICG